MSRAGAVALALLALLVAAGSAGPAGAAPPSRPSRFERPVPGPVVDPYRPPACRWCPGNRGIDFAASPGEAVRGPESGTVTFAGTVGDDRFVVVAVGELRVTYGFVAEVLVAEGQRVRRGQVLATAAGPLHVGVRHDGQYLDPTPYFQAQLGRPHLVPL